MENKKKKKLLSIKTTLLMLGGGLLINTAAQQAYLKNVNVTTESFEIDKTNATLPEFLVEWLTYTPVQEYYDIPIYGSDFQDFCFNLCEENGIPHEILFTAGDTESGGKWNTNGKISPTNDYGLFQINITNHKTIEQVFGYSSDDLLYDPYKNAEAAVYILKTIFNYYNYDKDHFEYENVFGTYNGGVLWKSKEDCQEYVAICMEALEEKYSKIELVRTKK